MFALDLVSWYQHHLRHLPWRQTNDPYLIWISEIMLQQTQVDTVIPYYLKFIERFNSVEACLLYTSDAADDLLAV